MFSHTLFYILCDAYVLCHQEYTNDGLHHLRAKELDNESTKTTSDPSISIQDDEKVRTRISKDTCVAF